MTGRFENAKALGVVGGGVVLLLLLRGRAQAGAAPSSQRAPEQRAPEQRAPEQRAPEQRAPEQRAPEQRAPERLPSQPGKPKPIPNRQSTLPVDGEDFGQLSEAVALDITDNGPNYDHEALKLWQAAYNIAPKGAKLTTDGKYGPASAQVLRGVIPDAPNPIYGANTAAGRALATSKPKGSEAYERTAKILGEPSYEEQAIKMMRARRAADLARIRARQQKEQHEETSDEPPQERGDAGSYDSDGDAGGDVADAGGMDASQLDADSTEGEDAPGTRIDLATKEAPKVAAHLRKRGRMYSHQLIADFQRHAGIAPSGRYDGETVSALHQLGVRNPPAALFT